MNESKSLIDPRMSMPLLMDDMNLCILSREVSQKRRLFEKTDFNIKRTLPVPAERIVTVLENSLVKMDLVAALPWICSSLVDGNPQLEYILGPKCIRALVHLMTAQMAWREAKSREIPTGRSSLSLSPTMLRFHMTEGRVSDSQESSEESKKDKMKPSREMRRRDMEKDNNVSTLGISTRNSQSVHTFHESKSECSSQSQPHFQFPSSSSSMIIKNKKLVLPTGQDNHVDTLNNLNAREKMTQSRRRRLDHDRIISILKNDEAKMSFLWSLIRSEKNVENQNQSDASQQKILNRDQDKGQDVREQVDAPLVVDKKPVTDTSHRLTDGKNIVRLIKAALNSRYEDHVRKALKEKDSKALLCMLSLVGGDDDNSNLLTRHSSPRGHKHGPTIKIEKTKEKRKTFHKPTCRKLAKCKLVTLKQLQEKDSNEDEEQMENIIEFFKGLSHKEEMSSSSLSSYSSEYGLNNLFSNNSLTTSKSSDDDKSRDEQSERLEFGFEFGNDFEEQDQDQEQEWNEQDETKIETSLSRTQQMIRIPYYSHSDSDSSSSSSSYEDDDQIDRTSKFFGSRQTMESDKEQGEEEKEERQGDTRHLLHNDDSIEQWRKGSSTSEQASPYLSSNSINEQMQDESEINFQKNANKKDDLWESKDKGRTMNRNKMSKEYWEKEVRRAYKEACNLISLNTVAVEKIMEVQQRFDRRTCTPGYQSFQILFKALCQLMQDKLFNSAEADLICECKLREFWTNERRFMSKLRKLQIELKELEELHGPKMLTLDFQIRILTRRLRQVSNENFDGIRNVIRETQLNCAMAEKMEMTNVEQVEKTLKDQQENVLAVKKRHYLDELRLKSIRNDLDSKLREEIARYDEMAVKRQEILDNVVKETLANELVVQSIQEKFADVKDRFIDMRATKKLRQIKRNMEMADDFKRAKAAKMIQDFWRRYKIRKRRREKKKGKKGGKKKQGGVGGGKKKADSPASTAISVGGKPSIGNKSKTRS